MRPQKLEIEGLHSFQARQTVDFAALSAGGLFGIFGRTGSGKSTILDAIILALYGKFSAEEARQYINLKSGRAFVALEFTVHGRPYRVEREYKFSRKRDNVTASATLTDGADGSILCVQTERVNQKILELLGLTREEFCKVVALQQGEFAKFLKSPPAQQTEMAGKLFSLEKYGNDLVTRANARMNRRKAALDELESRIAEFAEATEPALREAEERLETLRREEETAVAAEEGARKISFEAQQKRRLTQELADARAALAEEVGRQKENAELLRRAEKKRAAAELYPLRRAREEACAALAERGKSRAELEGAASRAQSEQTQAAAELEQARRAAETARPEREKKREILHALAARREDFEEVTRKLAAALQEHRVQRARFESAQRAAAEQGAVKRELEALSAALEAERAALSAALSENVNPEFLSRLKGIFSGDLADAEGRFPGVSRSFAKTEGLIAGARTEIGLAERAKAVAERAGQCARELADCSARLAAAEGECRAAETERARIKAEGEVLRRRSDAYLADVTAAGLQNPTQIASALHTLEDEERVAQMTEKRLSERTDLLRTQAADLRARAAAAAAEERAAQDALREAGERFAGRFAGFANEEELCAVYAQQLSAEEILQAEEERRERIIRLTERVRTLSEQLGAEVGEETVRAAQTAFEQARAARADLAERRSACGAQVLRLTEQLAHKRALLEQKKTAEHRLAVAEAVQKAVRGKALMNFAVEEYLREICRSASVTLSGVTGGAYRLRYGDGRGFYVVDNRSGGECRDVATLSGGETFLVSLSLAVALSEAVALAGTSRVEFFFLDEGFGSLDRELCDVVVDALETLKEDRFVIGLISHVETLKERLPAKLFVSFDEELGSQVTI